MVARVSLLVLGLAVLCGGCGTWNDCIVHFEMREPDCPDDPNVMLTELKRELPDDVEIEYFFWRKKMPKGRRGIVTVTSHKAARKVVAAVRRNPRLFSVWGPIEDAIGGEFMVCLSSRSPFEPKSDKEVLDEVRRDLPDGVKMLIDASRRHRDGNGYTVWATVFGNFNKEAVKFACLNNPNVSYEHEEESIIFERLLVWCHVGRAKAIE